MQVIDLQWFFYFNCLILNHWIFCESGYGCGDADLYPL